ncbi:MAG: acyltransferase family protein [Planctomycetota bacterium]|nr:acyltransferase family protein [Planctomycetota bacterium]
MFTMKSRENFWSGILSTKWGGKGTVLKAEPIVSSGFSRRNDLDALRAFAMFLGIALHGALSFVAFPWPIQDRMQHEGFSLFFFVVHGFRMPVFFLMSGFFTAMLWRRRGLKALISHRFKRVLLPCLAGLLTVAPAVSLVSALAMRSASREFESSSESRKAVDLWGAAASGNIKFLGQLAEQENVDLNAPDPKLGITPLAWASVFGKEEAVRFLIRKGADVGARNRDGGTALHSAAFLGQSGVVELLIASGAEVDSRNKERSTPLHGAAFLGRERVAELLIENGADPLAKNRKGETPFDSARVDWKITSYIAKILRIPVTREVVEKGRLRIIALLGVQKPGKRSEIQNREKFDRKTRARKGVRARYWEWVGSSKLMTESIFHHLWFLWFLCWLVVVFVVVAWAVERFSWGVASEWWVVSPIRFVWLLPLTMVPQWVMGPTGGFGPDTSTGLFLMPHIFLYYGLFFGFGALYYHCEDGAGRLGAWWWLSLPVALLFVFPVGLECSLGIWGFRENWMSPGLYRPVSGLFQVLFAWMMTFGLMGLFRTLLNRESKLIRYLSDSSYWLYVAHLPLIMLAQWGVRDWEMSPIFKFTLVCGVGTGLLLLSYQLLVRHTWLGFFLNGTRHQPSDPVSVPGEK